MASTSSVLAFAALLLPSLALAQATVITQSGGDLTGAVVFQGGGVVPIGGAPARDTPPAATGTSVIRGRIIDASNGTPVRKATIRLTGGEIREMRGASTDAEGRYEFKDLPAGRFTLFATKAGYVEIGYGQTAPFEPGKPIAVGDKQTVEKIDFALPRGAVITGRVLDEYGEPIADAQVMSMRNQFTPAGRRPMMTGRPSTTNDIGEFRLYGLAPGQYFISATYRQMGFGPAATDSGSGYAPTYYPGTSNIAQAQSLTVDLSGNLSDVTLMMVPTHMARITGTAIDSQGRPVRQGSVMVMSRGGAMPTMTAGGPIRPDGTFTISGVPPGEYMLRGMVGMPSPGNPPETAVAFVTVNGDDVAGVRLEPVKPISVSGRVVLDPVAARAFKSEAFRIGAVPTNPADQMIGLPMTQPAAVRGDLTFDFKTYPGTMVVRLLGSVNGWMIKAVYLNGADVTNSVNFRSDDVDGLEVELTNRVPDVSGLVANGKGEYVKDYYAIAFPQDQIRWTNPGPGQNAMVRPDQDGRFRIQTLKPGEYYLAAVEHLQNGEWMDPEFLEAVRAHATRISLSEGDIQTRDLTLSQGR
jgi:protocatechuate 3,4-dioxygenase beta subunit